MAAKDSVRDVSIGSAVQEFTCGTCNQGNRMTEASHYCPDCDQCYCRACLCDHSVLGKADLHRWGKRNCLSPTEQTAGETGEDNMCLFHPGFQLDRYCRGHDVVFCNLCLSVTHRTCSDTTKLADMQVQDSETQIEKENLQRAAESLAEDLEKALKDRVMKKTIMSRSHNNYLDIVRDFRSLVNITFDSIKKNAETLKNQYIDKFEADELSCENGMAKLVKVQEAIRESEGQTLGFTFLKKWKEWVKGQKVQIGVMHKTDVKMNFRLIDQSKIKTSVQQIEDLGKVQLDYPAISVKSEADKKVCEIVGICQLGSGVIVLADAANQNLKLLDESYVISCSVIIDHVPTSLCLVSDTEIAIASVDTSIQFMTVDSSGFKVVRTIRFEFGCSGLDSLNEEIYILTGCQNTDHVKRGICECERKVYICNHFGNVIRQFTVIEKGNSFYLHEALTLDKISGEIYVSSCNYLHVFNSKGERLASNHMGYENISLCSSQNGKVFISKQGRTVAEVKRDKGVITYTDENYVSKPGVLCWDKRIGRLVVACSAGDDAYLV